MNISDVTRILQPLKNKIFLLIGRAILEAVKNSGGTQKIQVTGLNGEPITDIERLQNYGFESVPSVTSDAEALIAFVNGNRDQGVAIIVADRGVRPKLNDAEVSVYHKDGKTFVLVKKGEVHITGGGTLEFAPLASKIKSIVDAQVNAIYNKHTHPYLSHFGTPLTTSPTTQPMTDQAQSEYESTEVKIS